MYTSVKIGIIGGAGYTAGELLRILLRHPQAEIVFVHSESHAGQPVWAVHDDLMGETELRFSTSYEPVPEVVFLCTGHGKSAEVLARAGFPATVRVIDLSMDYRLAEAGHDFVYGLPELNRDQIRTATHVANPGCFATCIEVGLLPLAQAHLLPAEVHITAITGSTGAGQKPEPTTHFSWRNNNLSVYKPFTHQHLPEIRQSLRQLQPDLETTLNFVPVRGDFTRGIFASIYLDTSLSEAEARALYAAYYQDHPFTIMAPSNPHLKQVVNTNKALIWLEKHGEKLLIISMIDNLLKGASGQAVQNMNLMTGLPEETGLWLKGVGF
ncbi:MAG: N-acetyl-gamma-glutamyl-phosphate reductase [Bacteroidia bacterium]|nr:N-acetyl-gamma-glutamyl-phosphate reductase [Bacteroidia bacterium]